MKNIIQSIRNHYQWAGIVLVAGIFLGWLFFHPSRPGPESANQELQGHEGHDHAQEQTTIWTCSMHPQIRQEKAGKCPICGMDLIPLSNLPSDREELHPDEIQMTASAAGLADIQTVIVKKGVPNKELFLQGKVQADERNMAELTARFGGRIEKLYVSYTGENVSKGDPLAMIYSPELVTAQRELLEAMGYRDTRPALYQAARGKLRLWDLTEEQITAIEENGEPQVYFDVLSPISGTVTKRHVATGDYVKEGSELFEVIDLTRVWIMFDAYESDLPWIGIGDRVSYTVQSLPGRSFEGKVSYIDPFIHPSTRVAKVRVNKHNPGLILKPEMFVNGLIESRIAANGNEILIPKSSILWTGKRAVVYVKVPDREQPSFRYREIDLGPESGNSYVVSNGLAEGDEIAVNGVFRIDAAAQLAGKPSMMNPGGGSVSMAHDHGSMVTGSAETSGSAETTGAGEDHAGHREMDMGGQGAEISDEFREQLQAVYDRYIGLKNALVASDAGEASKQAQGLESALDKVDMDLLDGAAHMNWMRQQEILNQEAGKIASSQVLDEQRLAFAAFNDAFYESLKTFGLHHGTVYHQYCPMARGDEGAYWFSNVKEIKNPYFGDMMLSCGETRETLEF